METADAAGFPSEEQYQTPFEPVQEEDEEEEEEETLKEHHDPKEVLASDQDDDDDDDVPDEYWEDLASEEKKIWRNRERKEAKDKFLEPCRLREDEVLAKYTQDGVFSTYQSIAQSKNVKTMLRSKDYIEKVHLDLIHKQALSTDLLSKIRNDERDLRGLEARVHDQQNKLQDVVGTKDLRKGKQDKLQKQLEASQRRVQAKEALLNTEENLLKMAERDSGLLQVKYSKLKGLGDEIEAKESDIARERKEVARHLMVHERKLDRSLQRRMIRKQAEKDKEDGMRRQIQDDVVRQSKLHRVDAIKWQRRDQQVVNDARKVVEQQRRDVELKRVRSVLELKNSTEQSLGRIRRENSSRRKQEMKLRSLEADEAKEIERSGGNPEAVFRTRRMRKMMLREQEQRKADIIRRELEIVARVQREHAEQMKAEADRFKTKMAERQYHLSLGRQYAEQRDDEYMRRITGTTNIIDPSGKQFRLHPSRFARLKDMGFGLGGADDDVIEHVRKRFPNVTPNALLLNATREPNPAFGRLNPPLNNTSDHDDHDHDDDVKRFPSTIIDSDAHKHKLLRLRAQHRDWIERGVDKLVCGKRYDSVGFLAQPNRIVFRDFNVGETLTQSVHLTNVSFGFNSFKVLDLHDGIEVDYERLGRMSAGITALINVRFTPTKNEDVTTELRLLTESGPLSIPIEARTKKTLIEMTPMDVVDFGVVVQGESSAIKLKIANKGAIDATFTLEPTTTRPEGVTEHDEGENDVVADVPEVGEALDEDVGVEYDDDGVVNEFVQRDPHKICEHVTFPTSGHVNAFQSTTLTLRFSPVLDVDASFELALLVRFTNDVDDDGDDANASWGSARDFRVIVRGSSRHAPVYLPNNLLDLQCCVIENTYRDVVELCNRSSASFKVSMNVPTCLRAHVECCPRSGFVQGHANLRVLVQFRPTASLRRRAQQFIRMHQGRELLRFPLTIIAAQQREPIELIVHAVLTSATLRFSTSTLAFGASSINESRWLPLTIMNDSLLLQRLAFTSYPKDVVSLEPSDGFLALLPGESRSVSVHFRPRAPIDYAFALQCHTKLGDAYTIRCVGSGSRVGITLSSSVLRLAACAVGTAVGASIFVSNTTNQTQMFEFAVPSRSFLKLLPALGQLAPAQTSEVYVEFEPVADSDDVTRDDDNDDDGAGSNVVEYSNDADNEGWSRHGRHRIPFFFKAKGFDDDKRVEVAFLQVETTAVLPTISADVNELHFGQVAIGNAKTLELFVRNTGDHRVMLRSRSLPSSSPFTLLNALRPLDVGGRARVLIEFRPVNNLKYNEVFELSQQLRIRIDGEGAVPDVEIFPDDDVVDVGDVVMGDRKHCSLTIHNRSLFALPFEVKVLELLEVNHSSLDAFRFLPSRGSIPPGNTQDVDVVFAPDHESDAFCARVQIHIPNVDHQRVFRVQGRSWSRQLFVRLPSSPASPEHVGDALDFIDRTEEPDELRPLQLRLKDDGERVLAMVKVGSCSLAQSDLKGSAGTFELEVSEAANEYDFLRVEPRTGSLNSADEKDVAIIFDRDKWNSYEPTGIITSITQRVSCRLKGSLVVSGPEERHLDIVCRIKLD